jgi:hypothetical protein
VPLPYLSFDCCLSLCGYQGLRPVANLSTNLSLSMPDYPRRSRAPWGPLALRTVGLMLTQSCVSRVHK